MFKLTAHRCYHGNQSLTASCLIQPVEISPPMLNYDLLTALFYSDLGSFIRTYYYHHTHTFERSRS